MFPSVRSGAYYFNITTTNTSLFSHSGGQLRILLLLIYFYTIHNSFLVLYYNFLLSLYLLPFFTLYCSVILGYHSLTRGGQQDLDHSMTASLPQVSSIRTASAARHELSTAPLSAGGTGRLQLESRAKGSAFSSPTGGCSPLLQSGSASWCSSPEFQGTAEVLVALQGTVPVLRAEEMPLSTAANRSPDLNIL